MVRIKEKIMDERSISDILFDEDNHELLTLYGDNGEELSFEQVAILPMDYDIFAILKPVDPDALGIAPDEVLVFELIKDADGFENLIIVQDEKVADCVFDEYERMLDDAGIE